MNEGALNVWAVRGAVQVEADQPEKIREATGQLLTAVMDANGLEPDSIVSLFFTMTPDLTSDFPALAAHEFGLTDVPMMCAAEVAVPGIMPRVIRMLGHVRTDRPRSALRHQYLGQAGAIRPEAVRAARASANTARGLVGGGA